MSNINKKPKEFPILRDCQNLLLAIEQAVRTFPRYHKYTLGSDMRKQAMLLCRLVHRALNAKGVERVKYVQRLQNANDDLKIQIKIAKELHAYKNFNQFQQIAELVVTMGKQGGRWNRQLAAQKKGPALAGQS